ncbi:cyclic nucleotide-binding domain-containing protein [Acidovorax sp.]|uniref:cyclic nucleotide-binding domain-containing protein n=1 Tax=Acidovorax sp. TaxID=1872122 RepID=UPI0025BC2C94|nr:cyclic nucleotide-binding domain-containing protein [Acidovorax sp.]
MEMQLLAWIASSLVFASFFMKTIMPLRAVAIASNVVFIGYALFGLHFGIFDKVLPILILHLSLLPLNILRLREIRATIRGVKAATSHVQSMESLTPYMKRELRLKGEVIFRKGDPADRVYFIRVGRVSLPELGKYLPAGEMFGEIGVFSDVAQRTLTAVCDEDCELFVITKEKVVELFYLEPSFGFFIARLLTRYAMVVVDPLQSPVAGHKPEKSV